MLSVGVDIVEVERIAKALERFGDRFLARIYTPAEVDHCRGRVAELAARFAAKEAISRALGTGIYGLSWPEMEILPDPLGQPQVHEERNVFSEALLPQFIEQIEKQTGAEVVPVDGDGK